ADEAIVLELPSIGLAPGSYHAESGGKELPSQLADANLDGAFDTLILLADFAPAESKMVNIFAGAGTLTEKRTQAERSIKTGGAGDGRVYKGGTLVNVDAVRPPPQYTDHSEYIRYEGPGLESDKVAYRFYLDWRNGFDIFGKKTARMVLQQVGLDGYDSYH